MDGACEKQPYNNRIDSVNAMTALNKQYIKGKNKFKKIEAVYKCDICEKWHTTSKKPRVYKR